MTTWAGQFTITNTKTANYQAINAELIPCDTSGGSFTISAPVGPAFGISTAFGIKMDHQKNPITLLFTELCEQPTAQVSPKILMFDIVINGVLYVAFNGTEWLVV